MSVPVVVAGGVLVLALTGGVCAAAGYGVQHAVAAGAADAAALAAADAAAGWAPGVPCERAAQVAEAVGAHLGGCEREEGTVNYSVSVTAGGGLLAVTVSSRAGPGEAQ